MRNSHNFFYFMLDFQLTGTIFNHKKWSEKDVLERWHWVPF